MSQCKNANIVPIAKTSHPKTTGDYRPIALTSTLCKMLERIIVREILKYTKHLWKSNKQYGFLPGRNTMDALITVIDDWTKAIDVKSTVHAVFFDFQKAFDLVDHTILLNKLRRLKLPTWIISWVAQYLKGRKQRVKIGDKYSAWTDVAAGVIQGSVLGPTLFLLFIYDINEYIDSIIEIIKYADDIVIYNIIKDLSEDKVQDAVNGIAEWARINKMKLNEKKTQRMFINQKMHGPHLLNLNDEPLTETREYTYLGIKINQNMSCG